MAKTVALPLLERIEIASPCTARWDDMTGDERVRHCTECNLRVHNISAMTRVEAEALLRSSLESEMPGRLCVRLYRRADGTVLLKECPVGLARVRAAARRTLVRVAALIGLVGMTGMAAAASGETRWGDRLRLRALRPFSIVGNLIAPTPPAPGPAIMGALRALPTPPPPSSDTSECEGKAS